MTSDVSERVVEQRLRNRIIELLEMLVDFEGTIAVFGPPGYINFFYDWFPDQPPLPANSSLTPEEYDVLTSVLEIMNRTVAATEDVPDEEFIYSGWLSKVAERAELALAVMMIHGKLSEDVEVETT